MRNNWKLLTSIYRYDPGKYGSMNRVPGDDMLQRRITAYGSASSSSNGSERQSTKDLVVTKSEESSSRINNDSETTSAATSATSTGLTDYDTETQIVEIDRSK